MRECPECGYVLDTFDESCPRCARVSSAAQRPAPDRPTDALATRPHVIMALGIAAAIGLVLMLMVWLSVRTRHARSPGTGAPSRAAAADSRWQTAQRDPLIDPLDNYAGPVIAVNNPRAPDALVRIVRTVGATERVFIVSREGRAEVPASLGSYTIRFMFGDSRQVYETDPFTVFDQEVQVEITLRRSWGSGARRVGGGL